MKTIEFKIDDLIKIKSPEYPYQKDLKYKITKIEEKTIDCYELSNPKNIYYKIPKIVMIHLNEKL